MDCGNRFLGAIDDSVMACAQTFGWPADLCVRGVFGCMGLAALSVLALSVLLSPGVPVSCVSPSPQVQLSSTMNGLKFTARWAVEISTIKSTSKSLSRLCRPIRRDFISQHLTYKGRADIRSASPRVTEIRSTYPNGGAMPNHHHEGAFQHTVFLSSDCIVQMSTAPNR